MSADGSNSWSSDVAEPPSKEHFQTYGKPDSVNLTSVILVHMQFIWMYVKKDQKKDTVNMFLL